ncbi:MAG TPA: HAMP domain-containing methyl-accepting chemotaxis protein [Patescibacteria group bacterium]|nr:HAMP domain-containing methyl-accepting chemotaxis protein [Patescibacteria group bacterium]
MSNLSQATTADAMFPTDSLLSRLRQTNWGHAWRDGSFPLLSDLAVGLRVNLLLVVALAAALVFAAVSYFGEQKISQASADQTSYRRLGDLTSDVRAEALSMQTLEQEFLRTRNPDIAAEHRRASEIIANHVKEIAALPMAQPVAGDVEDLAKELVVVNELFDLVVATEEKNGLTDGTGLRGKLMKSVKVMEDELKVWPNLDAMWNKMLGMRQAEKDFMLYGSTEYLGKHRKYANEFDLKIDSSGLPASTADGFRKLLADYTQDMAAFAEASTELEVNSTNLRGQMDSVQPIIGKLFAYSRDGGLKSTRVEEQTRKAIQRNNATAGVLAMMVFFLLSLVLSRSIVAPLRLIEDTMRRLVGGEHQVRVPGTHRRDEIGDMARAVGVFKENALAMVALQHEHEDLMRGAEAERRSAMHSLADQFEGTVKKISDEVSKGADSISLTAERMGARNNVQGESLSLSVAEAAAKAYDSVTAARIAADELSASIHEVGALVSESSDIAKTGEGELEQADRQVLALSAAAKEIGAVLGLINKIAHQTNLLALNATIEAHRAGDAGKGFAVVAGEVKNLADQTAKATGQIASQIGAIQHVADDTAHTMDVIGGTIRRMLEITEAVNDAMQRQSAATDRIGVCVQAVSTDSRIVADGVIDVTQSAASYCGSAIQVLWAANDLAQPTQSLREEVNAFLDRVRS